MDTAQKFEDRYRAVPYPERPPRPKREDFPSHTAHGKAMDAWEKALVKHKKAEEDYRTAQNAVVAEFKTAIAEDLGLVGHPKFEQLYSIAYEEGHSSGLSEVYYRCVALAPLLTE